MRVQLMLVLILTTLAPVLSIAVTKTPICLGENGPLNENNNEQVIEWAKTTPNKFKSRALVDGTIVKINPDRTGHRHLLVQIGSDENAVIEVVYNEEFGETPAFDKGDSLQACGDYITDKYSKSSLQAVVHWVHDSPRPDRHAPGFIIVQGIVYGLDN